MRRSLLLPVVLLAGCDLALFEDELDKASGYLESLVMEGVLLGVAPVESDQIDLSGTDYAQGVALSVFLADAASADQLEEAVLTGATVKYKVGGTTSPVPESGEGLYRATSDDGIAYSVGADFIVNVTAGDLEAAVAMKAPGPADLTIPAQHAAGDNLLVDLSGYDYDSVLAVVLDTLSGEVTWSNQPEDITAIYDFTHGGGVNRLEIPARAFGDAEGSVYAVGIAGMQVAGEEDFNEMNTALSSMMAGQMKFYPVTTVPVP